MSFYDKTFYKINKKYSVALPHNLSELKEIAVIDKDEQSLIKVNIEFPSFPSNDKNTNNLMACNYCNNNKQGNQYLNPRFGSVYNFFPQTKLKYTCNRRT